VERNVLPRGPRGTKRASFLRQIPLVDAYPPEDKDAGGRTRKKEEETEEDTPTRARSLIMYIYPFLDPTLLHFADRSQARELPLILALSSSPHSTRISWSPVHPTHNTLSGPSCTKVNPSNQDQLFKLGLVFTSFLIYFFYVVLTYSLSLPFPPPRWWLYPPSLPSASNHLHTLITSLHTTRSDHLAAPHCKITLDPSPRPCLSSTRRLNLFQLFHCFTTTSAFIERPLVSRYSLLVFELSFFLPTIPVQI